jgi:NitT/TauT family transport system substrate-binding protein
MMKRAAVLAGSAAFGLGAGRARAQSTATIRIAVLPSETMAEPFYGNDMGFFGKAGIEATVQTMASTSAIGAAIAGGSIDIGGIAVDTLGTMHQRNIPITVIAACAEYAYPQTANITALLVANNSPIRTAKDLSGKTVAANSLHGLAEIATALWIDKNGGDSTTLKFVELPFPAMPAALASGRVDAAFILEPNVTIAKKTSRILADCYFPIARRFSLNAWCCAPEWATAHPDLVKRFTAAVYETAQWANRNHAATAAIVTKYLKLDAAVANTMVRARYAEELNPALLQPLIDVSSAYNHTARFPATQLIYPA